MKILLNSDSVAIFVGLSFTLTAEGLYLPDAFSAQCTTANCTVIEVEPPPYYVSNVYKWENNAWTCIDQPAVDAYIAEQIAKFNQEQSNKRLLAYTAEADGIYFKWQRGEATQQEWLDKVAEIKARYPYIT
jgi:hypothetical protein